MSIFPPSPVPEAEADMRAPSRTIKGLVVIVKFPAVPEALCRSLASLLGFSPSAEVPMSSTKSEATISTLPPLPAPVVEADTWAPLLIVNCVA